jgi:Glycosyl hydrolase family 79 C-terminal beta domain
LPVTAPSGPVKVWATLDPKRQTTHVVLINKDSIASHEVQLQLPGGGAPATLEWLQAPGVAATSGVTLGGRSFGSASTTGTLGAPQIEPITPLTGYYTLTLPPGSAVLLTQ